MKIAHLADLHLGHRAFQFGHTGRNEREADVARAFEAAIEDVVAEAPDVVLVAGDVFDQPDPPHSAIVTLARGIGRLREGLSGVRVCMVAGSRDTPADSSEPGALEAIDAMAGVDAVTSEFRSVRIGELNVVLVPHRLARTEPFPEFAPDPTARWNALLTYGSVSGRREGGVPIRGIDWDYIALGHEHAWRQVQPRMFFAGSLEKVGPAPWTEAGVEKGYLVYDLEDRESTFRRIPGRAVVALAPLAYEPDRPERVAERIREVLDEVPGGIEGKVVRLRVQGVPPERLGLIQEVLPDYRRRALHLEVQLEEGPDAAVTRARALADRVARRLEGEASDLGDLTRLVEETLGDANAVSGGHG